LVDFARRFDQFARIHLKKKIENGKQLEAKKLSCNQQWKIYLNVGYYFQTLHDNRFCMIIGFTN
jgi:hypothetical protein